MKNTSGTKDAESGKQAEKQKYKIVTAFNTFVTVDMQYL